MYNQLWKEDENLVSSTVWFWCLNCIRRSVGQCETQLNGYRGRGALSGSLLIWNSSSLYVWGIRILIINVSFERICLTVNGSSCACSLFVSFILRETIKRFRYAECDKATTGIWLARCLLFGSQTLKKTTWVQKNKSRNLTLAKFRCWCERRQKQVKKNKTKRIHVETNRTNKSVWCARALMVGNTVFSGFLTAGITYDSLAESSSSSVAIQTCAPTSGVENNTFSFVAKCLTALKK